MLTTERSKCENGLHSSWVPQFLPCTTTICSFEKLRKNRENISLLNHSTAYITAPQVWGREAHWPPTWGWPCLLGCSPWCWGTLPHLVWKGLVLERYQASRKVLNSRAARYKMTGHGRGGLAWSGVGEKVFLRSQHWHEAKVRGKDEGWGGKTLWERKIDQYSREHHSSRQAQAKRVSATPCLQRRQGGIWSEAGETWVPWP
jgi:hypothetical protein